MAMQLCILLFPDLTNGDQIDRFRARFDPLAQKIAPHVTLVFPFASASLEGDALAGYVAERIQGIGTFEVEASLPAVVEGGYVYLRINAGAGDLRRMHDTLY